MHRWKVNPIGKTNFKLDGIGKFNGQVNMYKLNIKEKMLTAYGVKKLPTVNQSGFKKEDIEIPEMKDKRIGLVIGTDNYSLIHPLETHKLKDVLLVRDSLGWNMYGCAQGEINNLEETDNLNGGKETGYEMSKENTSAIWGIAVKNVPDKEPKTSIEDEIMAEKFEKEFKIENVKIYAPLLIHKNIDECNLCPIGVASGRLIQQLKQYKNDKALEERYDEKMYEYSTAHLFSNECY